MARGMLKRYLSICLVAVMLLTTLLPVRVFAADEAGFDDANTNYEDPADTEPEEPSFTLDEPESAASDVYKRQSPYFPRFRTMRASFPASKFWKGMPTPMRQKTVRTPMR